MSDPLNHNASRLPVPVLDLAIRLGGKLQGSLTARVGNYTLIRCKQFDILLGHLRKGNLRVMLGDFNRQSRLVGGLGSSRACDMPHLCIPDLRLDIDFRYLVCGDRP